MQVNGNTLTITVDLSKNLGPSKSGKTTIIATTAGNISIPGTDAKAGINIYILIERTNILSGNSSWGFISDPGGNMDRSKKRFHGWRGTTDDIEYAIYDMEEDV